MAIIVPEVFADAVNAKMTTSLRVATLATDYTQDVPEIETCGGSVSFPTFDRITDADVVTKGTALTPEDVNMTDCKADIKQVGKSVRVYDKDNAQVKGSLKDRLAEQLGDAMAKSVDGDLVKSISADAAYKEDVAIASFTEDSINGAFDVFGDDVDNDTFSGILINSKLRKYIVKMDSFTDSTRTTANAANGVVMNGIIGYWNGTIPVVTSDNGTYDSTKKVAQLVIVKKDALGYVFQKSATTEEEREAKLLATDLVASEMYATKLVKADGVSILNITLA